MLKNVGITQRMILLVMGSSIVILTTIFSYHYHFTREVILKNIEESAGNLAYGTVNSIDRVLETVEKTPENLAVFLEEDTIPHDELLATIKELVSRDKNIYGSTVAFEPYAFQKDLYYFSPYFYRGKDEIKYANLGTNEYNYFDWEWYKKPKELNAPVWSEPYFDEGGGNIAMATYSVPLYQSLANERQFRGVVTADISLLWLEKLFSSLQIHQSGYGFLLSKSGTLVAHPNKELVLKMNIFQLAKKQGDNSLKVLGEKMTGGETGFIRHNDFHTGQKGYLFYTPTSSNSFSLGLFFPEEEFMADITSLFHEVIWMACTGLLLLLVIVVFILRAVTHPLRDLTEASQQLGIGNLDAKLPVMKYNDEVGKLTNSFGAMQVSLKEYIKNLGETTAAKEKIESELTIARDIQMGIVPKIFPPFPNCPEIDLFATLEPAREVGGDLYDFFFLDNDRFCFVIGDVSDKGVPASLFMAVTKTLIKSTFSSHSDPAKVVELVNNELSTNNDSCMFVTLFIGVLHVESGLIDFVNAGHNPPLLLSETGEVAEVEKTGGIVVGAMEDLKFKMKSMTLQPGDTLFLYTDGVTEAMNPDYTMFTDARLMEELGKLHGKPVKEQISVILEKVREFADDAPQSDDITMMSLKYLRSA